MTRVTVSAPGKVIVAGEYAVLDGAPAICMAVNRRARVGISSTDESQHCVSAPGLLPTSRNFSSIDDVADELPLLANVWRELTAAPTRMLKIDLDSREFKESNGAKIGLGSSAAVAVALTAALNLVVGGDADVREKAMAAHRALQGGSGSGADIACSHAGGIIEYRMQHSDCPKLTWPADLHYALLWSGQSADTTSQLRKLAATESSPSRMELADAALVVVSAWREGDVAKLVLTIADYTKTLRRFDRDHRLGIFGAGHAALVDAASGHVVYKPCGAGAGDLGIALSADRAALSAFVDLARQHKFEPLDLRIDTTGIELEGTLL